MNDRQQIHIRMPNDLLREIARMAETEERSRNGEIRQLLREAVAARKDAERQAETQT